MPHRPFVSWPAKVLRTRATEVDEITDDIRALWDEMVDAMDAMPGVGLAAPQLGVSLRLIVVDASDKRGRAVRMANPTILQASQELRLHEEASPNLPGFAASLERPRAVTIRYMNEAGLYDRKDFVGLWATSMQHQIDHLDGKMYFDRLSRTKRAMLIKKAQKAR